MTSKVHFSLYCIIISTVFVIVLAACIIILWNQPDKCAIISVISACTILAALYYCPISVSVDAGEVKIRRLLSGYKKFKISEIEATDICYPSAGGKRICGSGGFFGYWGYFSDKIIGQYFGYYADRSQCFYIRLKNKRQYVISCHDYADIVKDIQSHLPTA